MNKDKKAGDHTLWVKQFSVQLSADDHLPCFSPIINIGLNGDEILVSKMSSLRSWFRLGPEIPYHRQLGVYDVKKKAIREIDTHIHKNCNVWEAFIYSKSLLLNEGTRYQKSCF